MQSPFDGIEPEFGRSRRRAQVILAVAIVTAMLLVGVTLSPLKSGFADAPWRGPSDVALYRAEVDRIHSGEGYYQAASQELRARGYPTRSVFNWRTPLPTAAIGWLPDPNFAKFVLGGFALLVLLFGFGLIADECGIPSAVFATLFLTGAALPCGLGNLFVMSELWAGTLIALSIIALGRDRMHLGVTAGLAALFLRELTGLYCLIALAIAVRRKNWKEAGLWMGGLAAYAIYFAVHAWHVRQLIRSDDIAHAESWLRFGGAAFVISTAQMNAYLLLLPQWMSAVYLALALLGFSAWNSPAGQRAAFTAAAYLAAFAMVGHDFNQYWGSMFAPLLCLGAGHGVSTAIVLAQRGFQSRSRLSLQSVQRTELSS
jgi:hypothetical protein